VLPGKIARSSGGGWVWLRDGRAIRAQNAHGQRSRLL